MAEVVLAVGGRSYTIACRDGGEDHLRALAARVDAKVEEARGAVGTASEVRQLLFAALLLADDLSEAKSAAHNGANGAAPDTDTVHALASLAARMESLADTLEQGPPTP
ncbi:cell division protein ZapA [Sphingomonas sp. SUN039]|uniref:cell division protein ZapA n=1 Tax=Sphingomonas sp. SUN039 TaxID=2937787 RepID=UPI0021643719|nr:cell division protein ZapA [Sphingomonas sp. SUN039]UVO53145.1 cell division protein ZapA [Sphingomonas sp. SUN039]